MKKSWPKPKVPRRRQLLRNLEKYRHRALPWIGFCSAMLGVVQQLIDLVERLVR